MKYSKLQFFAAIVFVLIFVFLSYLPALKSDFVKWDDPAHLLENASINSLDFAHIQKMFTSSVHKIYIPLSTLSFAVEYHFFKFNPFVYHLNNILLHLAVVSLILLFAFRLRIGLLGAVIAALVFGLHPMHVESVAWVTERKDVLYAAFYMGAIISYLKYLGGSGQKRGFLILTYVLGVLSMLSKPMAISLPFILFLLDWFEDRKINVKILLEKLLIFVVLGLIALITYSGQARMPISNIWASLLIWIWTFVFYIRQFLFPIVCVPIYKLSYPVSILNPEYLSSVVAFLSILFLGIYYRRNKWFVFALLFYLFSIFFLLRFDANADTNIVADRWMYLPSLGFCLLIGRSAQDFSLKVKGSGKYLYLRILAFSVVILFAGLFWKNFNQVKVWNNTVSLWLHQLKYYPNDHIALTNMATFLRELHPIEGAQQHIKAEEFIFNGKQLDKEEEIDFFAQKIVIRELYERAVKAAPGYPDVHYNLARFYEEDGFYEQAIVEYKNTLMLFSGFKDTSFRIGNLYRISGNIDAAVDFFQKGLKSVTENNRMYVEYCLKDVKKSVLCFTDANKDYDIRNICFDGKLFEKLFSL